jgi:hypothetical protein
MSAAEITTRTDILWAGENSFVMLRPAADAAETMIAGYFRIEHSPAGAGRAVFVVGDLGGAGSPADRLFAAYADDAPVGRWLLDTIVPTLPEFQGSALAGMPIRTGRFSSVEEGRASRTDTIVTPDGEIVLRWRDLGTPFHVTVPKGAVPSLPYEVRTTMHPAASAELTFAGRRAAGQAFPVKLGREDHSTAFLALGETWFR